MSVESENAMGGLSGSTVPKLQKQKPVDDDVPEDSTERKRVLNVLAQRRYRRRKKEQQAQLESFMKALQPGSRESSCNVWSQPNGHSSSFQHSATVTTEDHRGLLQVFSRDAQPLPSQSGATLGPQFTEPQPSSSSSSDLDSAFLDAAFSAFVNCSVEPTGSTNESSADSGSDSGISLFGDWPLFPVQDLADRFSSFLQDEEVQSSTFADDYLVSVPELDLLRASHTIALRLHSADRLFDPQATSIFQSQTPFDWNLLPENLRPTSAQLRLPHHPILDLLPWPKVRTKLITMYAIPSQFWPRHPSDKAEMSPLRLVYDMEDGGVRVYGDDPTSPYAWEVDQTFVNAWWWALDQNVICSSNAKRRARGEEILRVGSLGG